MKLQHKPSDSPSQYGGHGVRTTPGDVVDTEEIDSDQDADELGEALLETGYFQRVDEATDENKQAIEQKLDDLKDKDVVKS